VRLREDSIARHARRSRAQLAGVGVRDVAGERNVVAALERDGKQVRGREAVEDDSTVETRKRCRRLVVCLPRVHDDRLPEAPGELELRLEHRSLCLPRGVVAVEVEPGLADRDSTVVAEELLEVVERLSVCGLVRVDAERYEDALLLRS